MTLDKHPNEEWRDVVGHEGYYLVSNLANVYSLKINKILKPIILEDPSNGRKRKYIRLTKNKKTLKVFLHRLVAMAFCDGYKKGLQVNHIDCDRLNNMADNLEWVTRNENMRHAANNNILLRGVQHHKAKLKEEDVLEILKLFQAGESPMGISKKFPTSNSNVWCIVRGKIWKEIFYKFHGVERSKIKYKDA